MNLKRQMRQILGGRWNISERVGQVDDKSSAKLMC
jgi:hypothetical protein